ncbi:MAG: dihydrodipicolinate synthase family protein [Candidatus Thorarchaeota archaeon]
MKFKGIIPAMITPFSEDGKLYYNGLINELEYLYESGFKNIFVCGSYGSFPLLTPSERMSIADVVCKYCSDKGIKTIIHIGSASTQEAVYLAKAAEICGADAVSSVVPYYYSSSFYNENNYLKYFETIINSVDIDVHLYNNPKTTGYNVSLEFLKRLVNIGLKGIKDGTPKPERVKKVLSMTRDFDYYPSSTAHLIIGFELGVSACISGVSLSVPKLVLDIYENIKTNPDYSKELHEKVMKVRSILGLNWARAIAAYDVLNVKGVDVGTCREPWIKLSSHESSWIIDELKKLEVLR